MPWPDRAPARGHAVEARIYAEDPAAGFLPDRRPGAGAELARTGVRVDAGITAGSVVGSDYDPMLAKVIAHGADRAEALARLARRAGARPSCSAWARTSASCAPCSPTPTCGPAGSIPAWWSRRLDGLVRAGLPADLLPAAAGLALAALEPSGAVVDPFDIPGGWRVGEPAWTTWRMTVSGTASAAPSRPRSARAAGPPTRSSVAGDADPVRVPGRPRRGPVAGCR